MEPYDAAYFEETHRNWFAHPNLQLLEKIARLIDREPGPSGILARCRPDLAGRGELAICSWFNFRTHLLADCRLPARRAMRRLAYIEALRGYAILGVIAVHASHVPMLPELEQDRRTIGCKRSSSASTARRNTTIEAECEDHMVH
jgi:hypothetical protein